MLSVVLLYRILLIFLGAMSVRRREMQYFVDDSSYSFFLPQFRIPTESWEWGGGARLKERSMLFYRELYIEEIHTYEEVPPPHPLI